MHPAFRSALGLLLALFPAHCLAAAPDGVVEEAGVSHYGWQDRRPLCPVDNESFQVRFQAYRNDLTSARVRVTTGGSTWIDAAVVDTRGPYDVWAAQIPALGSTLLDYVIELSDGADVDYYGPNGFSDTLPAAEFEINYTTLEHAPLGATLLPGGGTVFKVWAPTRSSAAVRGEFNGWSTSDPMSKRAPYFIRRVTNAVDQHQYKYFFNSSHWNSDPRARRLNPSSNYNSYIEDPFGYTWVLDDFETPPLEELVIYQLHVGTFSGRNDPLGSPPHPGGFADVAARAGHLAELGVNAVMLNPITEFPGDLSAGYNPVTQWAPEWKYGTPDDFKAMVDVLHQNGIAVLLDIVWNHFSSTDNYLWNYDGTQIYFDTPSVETPWGSQADFDEPEVQDYFASSAHIWLEEYLVDGFRMDATDFMNMGQHGASGWALMQRINDEIDNRRVDKVMIAEQLPDDSSVTRPTSSGGAGFDSQYYDEFTDRLREETLDAVGGSAEMIKIQNIVLGGGTDLSGSKVTTYLELHDEAWPTSGGQRIVKTIDGTFPHDDDDARGLSKLAQGLVLTAPGVPAMLQGTEWLDDTDFGTSVGNRVDWGKKTTYAPIFAYYRDLIALRTGNSALFAGADVQVFRTSDSQDVIAFQRWDTGGNVLVVVANFSANDLTGYRLGFPQPGDWEEAINSQAPGYGGAGPTNAGVILTEAIPADLYAQSAVIDLPARSLVVFRWGTATSAPARLDDGATGLRFARIAPNPTFGSTAIEYVVPREGRVRLTVHDVAGRLVATLVDDVRPAGRGAARWDARTAKTGPVAPGVYFLRLEADDAVRTRKVALLR